MADKYKIPLYVLGANDLGTNARQVDNALESAFTCCRLWGALLLIDEADVFLEERNSDDLHRNELVAGKLLSQIPASYFIRLMVSS